METIQFEDELEFLDINFEMGFFCFVNLMQVLMGLEHYMKWVFFFVFFYLSYCDVFYGLEEHW